MIYNSLASLLIILALVLAYQNHNVTSSLTLLNNHSTLPVGQLLLCAIILTATGMYFWAKGQMSASKTTAQSASRQKEKLEVTAESATEKVKALEQKIQTLETALAKALDTVKK